MSAALQGEAEEGGGKRTQAAGKARFSAKWEATRRTDFACEVIKLKGPGPRGGVAGDHGTGCTDTLWRRGGQSEG
jgi:hypothetical protein